MIDWRNQSNLRPYRNKVVPAFLCIATINLLSSCQKPAPAAAQYPPPDVSVIEPTQQDVPVTGSWIATLDGYTNAQIQPQVSGYLLKQNYREGSLVHKGDVLFEIDPRPLQATLDQAQAQLAQARGQLGQAEAQLALNQINVKRDTPLAKVRAIAQSTLDNDTQALATGQATVQTSKAGIQAAEASIETAELNLGFTKVRSLITGVAGIATVQIGNLVGTSTTLTTVSQLDPIKAYFPISEQEYLTVADRIKPGSGGDWLKNSSAVPLQLTLADGRVFPQKGRIIFTERQVEAATGTIRVVGAFPNPGNILRPGQFGRISAVTSVQRNILLIPQRCVSELQGRYQVAVVGPDNKVSIKNVTTGTRVGEMWVIQSGLLPNEHVVSDGVSKVRDGSTVKPHLVSIEASKPSQGGTN